MNDFRTDLDDDAVEPPAHQDLPADDGWGDDAADTTQEQPSTVFLERAKDRDPNRFDLYFNQSGSFEDPHGHVVETRHPDGERTYHYARDEDGNEYIDDGWRRNRNS